MEFKAGPKVWDDSHHAVLWTRQQFKGDVKIEYEYTRTDDEIKMVNILYIQATGSDKGEYKKDILEWADLRTIPTMSKYYDNMNAYHISYAAFGTRNEKSGNDYIRARRYMPDKTGLQGTDLKPDYANTELFKTGVPHKITVIKHDRDIFMHIQNSSKELLCHWTNPNLPTILEGRIGLRHMYTRNAIYKNFRISTIQENTEPPGEHRIKSHFKTQNNNNINTANAGLQSKLKTAVAGDVFVLPAENLTNWKLKIKASGSSEKPIIIQGQGSNKTVFTGKSEIILDGCSYITLKDFAVSDNRKIAIMFKNAQNCRLTNCSFTKIIADEIVSIRGDSKQNRIEACNFTNNPSVNIRIRIGDPPTLSYPFETTICNNTFEDVPPIGGNGRETIQVGNNATQFGHIKPFTLVESNTFVRCNGEAEIISNKSFREYISREFL